MGVNINAMTYDLDDIMISSRVYQAWQEYAATAIADLRAKYPNLAPSEIPDEQFRDKPDGGGQIFVRVRNVEISLNVPAGEWAVKE